MSQQKRGPMSAQPEAHSGFRVSFRGRSPRHVQILGRINSKVAVLERTSENDAQFRRAPLCSAGRWSTSGRFVERCSPGESSATRHIPSAVLLCVGRIGVWAGSRCKRPACLARHPA